MRKIFLLFIMLIVQYKSEFPQQVVKNKSQITITDAWVRPAIKGGNSALYLVISNNGLKADAVIGAKSKLADIVEVHETYKMANDKLGMRQVKSITVPPKSKIEFKPGGYHVMLLDMTKDFKTGDKFDAVIIFKHACKIKVTAVVKEK
jgi:periplasmic copper chaperone A